MAERRSLAGVAGRAASAAQGKASVAKTGVEQAATSKQTATQQAVVTKTVAKKAPAKKTVAKKTVAKKTPGAKAPGAAAGAAERSLPDVGVVGSVAHDTTAVGKTSTAVAKAPRTKVPGRKSSGTTAPAVGRAGTSGEAVDVSVKVADAGRNDGAPAVAVAGTGGLPVRAGESPWTEAELEAIGEELSSELARMDREIVALQTNIDDVLRDSGDGVGDDQADSGAKAFEREQEMTLLATVRESRFQTERALERIAEASYGVCESCGGAIGKARLQAFPRATLCVTCKQRQERR